MMGLSSRKVGAVSAAVFVCATLLTGGAASAQGTGATKSLRSLGGPTRFTAPVRSVDALKRSIRRNGARLVEERKFIASNDPRQREQNNIRLLTGGNRDYDVVFVADTDGVFSAQLEYK